MYGKVCLGSPWNPLAGPSTRWRQFSRCLHLNIWTNRKWGPTSLYFGVSADVSLSLGPGPSGPTWPCQDRLGCLWKTPGPGPASPHDVNSTLPPPQHLDKPTTGMGRAYLILSTLQVWSRWRPGKVNGIDPVWVNGIDPRSGADQP